MDRLSMWFSHSVALSFILAPLYATCTFEKAVYASHKTPLPKIYTPCVEDVVQTSEQSFSSQQDTSKKPHTRKGRRLIKQKVQRPWLGLFKTLLILPVALTVAITALVFSIIASSLLGCPFYIHQASQIFWIDSDAAIRIIPLIGGSLAAFFLGKSAFQDFTGRDKYVVEEAS